jgi:hypothetical protein
MTLALATEQPLSLTLSHSKGERETIHALESRFSTSANAMAGGTLTPFRAMAARASSRRVRSISFPFPA